MNQTFTLLLTVFLLISHTVAGQSFNWANQTGGTGALAGTAAALDEKGNIFVSGVLHGTAGFGSTTISGQGSFITKYDNTGIPKWAMALKDVTVKGVSTDIYGYVYVSGNYTGTVQIGDTIMTSLGSSDIFLVKLNTDGHIKWVKGGGGPGRDNVNTIASDLYGNTYIAGAFESFMNLDPQTSLLSLGKGDMFVAKYDSFGSVQWANKAGGDGEDAGVAVNVDLAGNTYLTGKFSNTANFHNKIVTSHGGYDVFVTKYNSLGYQLLVETYGGSGDDVPAAMGIDGSAEIYITGTFNGIADFGGWQLSSNNNDAFLLQLNNKCSLQWVEKIGGSNNDAGTGICVDAQSNVFVTGVFEGSMGFDNGTKLTGHGSSDIFVAKYDGGGHVRWDISIRGQANAHDSSFAIVVDHNDIPVIAGSLQGQAGFGGTTLTGDSNGFFFMAQLAANPSAINPTDATLRSLDIYPNPTNDFFYINPAMYQPGMNKVTVCDMTGKIIEERFVAGSDVLQPINLESHPVGIYFIRLTTRNGNYEGSLIKM